jgi:homoserine O-acetyltransferase
MRVLEWLVPHPERVAAALVIGTTAAVGADQIGSHEAQIEAIRADQRFRGGDDYGARAGEGPHRGLGVARRIAQLSYRSRTEMELRFGRSPQIREDPFAWKDGRARGRFDANSTHRPHPGDEPLRPWTVIVCFPSASRSRSLI